MVGRWSTAVAARTSGIEGEQNGEWRGGSAGGRAKVPKGFASPGVMRKALRTRRANAKIKEAEERKVKSGASPNNV
jgi:hypothetical protein